MQLIVVCFLIAEALLALGLLYHAKVLRSTWSWAAAVILLAAAFVLRGLALRYETLDYQNFLAPWVEFYRSHGGLKALSYPLGNYNIPYLYFLALFSYSDLSPLYWIKLLSIFFDVLLAWAALRLCARFTESPVRRLACFFTVLLLPTVVLNGSLWGQCDSVYTALLLLALALALEDKPVRSMICLALAFGFKLQSVFVMPVFAVLMLYQKIRWKHLPVFPLIYLLLVLPAVMAGRPLLDTVTLYLHQTGSIGSGLNYNSPSIFAILWRIRETEPASSLAILAAFIFMLLVLAAARIWRDRLSDRAVLFAAVLFAVGIPFLLPHMHDRYFFSADILAVVLAFSLPWFCAAAPLTQFASLLGYHAYLKMRFLLPMWDGAYALIAALLLTVFGYIHALRRGKENAASPRGACQN